LKFAGKDLGMATQSTNESLIGDKQKEEFPIQIEKCLEKSIQFNLTFITN
jgi:hypothetical protein